MYKRRTCKHAHSVCEETNLCIIPLFYLQVHVHCEEKTTTKNNKLPSKYISSMCLTCTCTMVRFKSTVT